jgi:hypothetical protein
MKRLFLTVVVALSLGTATFAGNNNSSSNFISKMNEEKTFNGIASYLDADFEQRDALQYIFSEAERRMEHATKNGVSAGDATQKAIYFNLGNAKQVLSRDQYIKLVGILNLTINNQMNYELFAEK